MSNETDWRDGLGKRVKPDGSYVYVARWSDREGKKRTKTFPMGTSYKDAKQERAELVRLANLGFAQGSDTLDQFVEEVFWPLKAKKLRPYTLHNLRGVYRREIKPVFGRMRIGEVRASHVQQWVDASKLGASALRSPLSLLSQILKAAAVRDLSIGVSFDALELPPIKSRQHQVLTLDQIHELSERMGWYAPDIIFLAITGLRFSEYRALDESDIDLRGRKLTVSKSMDRFDNILETKTKAGKRVIDLHEPAADAWKAKLEQKLSAGRNLIAFPTETGYRTRHSHFYNDHWKPAIKALGWTLTPHDLRHTAASLMIRHGAPAQYVQHQLGHANPTITLNTYSHLFEDQSVEVNERMNAAYKEAK